MKLLPQQFGFTLMEVLVVIGLFAILTTLGLFFSMDFYRTYAANSQELTLVSALSKARARSLANVNQNQHGVHIASGQYILFQGDGPSLTWGSHETTLDQPIPVETGVNATDGDIVFVQLSGNAICTPDCTIELSGLGNGTKTVTVNEQGAILW